MPEGRTWSTAIEERALGASHPEVAASVIGLAIVYDSQGKYADAEALHKRALAIREKALGKDHPQVAKLLEILRITKQSLGRVLKQLIRLGYVVQMEGANDRRQRLLYVTSKGETLAMKLAELQTARIARALAELGPNARETACRFLAAVINAEQRDSVLRLIARADRGRRPRG